MTRNIAGTTCVAIASGGADSSTLLYLLRSEGYNVKALTFLYGQRHDKEIGSAVKICKILGVEHQVVDVSALKELLSSSALINRLITVPEVPETTEHYESLKTTIVPNRNAILLSIAVGFAVARGINRVVYGAHFSDRGVYPDCREEFVEAFQQTMRLATENSKLEILAPFVRKSKAEIIGLGSRLGVPYDLTWSCYNGGAQHCGRCSSCRERKRAFIEANVNDPTEYEA